MKTRILGIAIAALLSGTGFAHAAAPTDFLAQFEQEARRATPGFAASPTRGEQFFNTVQGKDWSCATCHSRDPRSIGKHATTGKPIEPMAPAVNAERLASERAVEKWFRRNCNDVLGRVCSPAEKADVVAYLISIKP